MKSSQRAQLGFTILAALYVLSFPYHPKLRSPNELCRLFQTRAIVDHQTLTLNRTMAELGGVGDLSCVATVSDPNGTISHAPCVGPNAARTGVTAREYYPSKAPLLSFLAVPVYWALLQIAHPVPELLLVFGARLFVTIIPTLVMLWWLRKFLAAQVSIEVADAATFVYGLGTIAFSYSEAFMSHQLTAVLLFGCFWCAYRVLRQGAARWWWLASGMFAGATVMCEYTGALGVLCVASFVLADRWGQWRSLGRAAALVTAGALPFLAALMMYHQVAFGSPLASGYKFLNDAAYMGWHEGGFLGIKWPSIRALGLSLFSPLRGLFALSPFLMVSVWGVKDVVRNDRALGVMLLVTLTLSSYFTSSFSYESWGWSVGPRHLTPILPFLILPFALVLERLKSMASRWFSVASGLGVSSVLATGLASLVNYVPDDVSTSVFGLTVPLIADGVWPVSWIAAWVPNPASGVFLVSLLVAAALWLVAHVAKLGARFAIVVAIVVLHLGALRLATANHGGDVGARAFLKSVWLAPNGERVSFF